MKVITIKRKNIFKITLIISFILMLGMFTTSFGMQYYYNVDFSTGLVTASTLNVRSGPGIQYKVIATVNKNEYIRVFAGVGDWYIVQVEGDYVGAVSKSYVKPIYPSSSNNGNTNNNTGSTITIESITLKENNDVCKNIGCVNMGYIIKDPSTYYLGASSKYEILNDGSEKTDSEKIVSVPITIENGSYTEISLLWKWVEENDRVDTLIGNKATDLNTIYELTVSVEFKVLNEQCKGV